MARSKNNLKQNKYVNGFSLKVTHISVVLILQRSLHILLLLKEKNETYHRKSKDIVLFNENQSKEILPSKEKLKLMTDNRQQGKRNKSYENVVVNITDNSELRYETKSDNGRTPHKQKIFKEYCAKINNE